MDLVTINAYLAEYPEIAWAAISGFFFIIEVGVATGIGFFFAAMAALTMSILVASGILDPATFWWHVGWFFLFTAAWAAVLWKPLKKWFKPKDHKVENFGGSQATILDKPLNKNTNGKARWSGAIMNARVHPDCESDTIAAKTDVWVVETDGSTLLVNTTKS